MPPPGSPPKSNVGLSTENADPYYSNKDVAILHDIVVLAQELLPNLPERERLPTNALFSAYYDILPRVGINADHDSRYARVLFKIGGLRGQGTLYEKFEEILSRMGIEIEFEQEDAEEQASQVEDSQTDQDAPTTGETSPQGEIKDFRHRPRRNSESSAWDLGSDVHSKPRTRRNSFSSFDPIKLSIGTYKADIQEHPTTAQQAQVNRDDASKDDKADENARTRLSTRPEKLHRVRGRSVSTHGSMRIRRRSPSSAEILHSLAAPSSEDYEAASELTAATTHIGDGYATGSPKPLQSATRPEEPGALMNIKASVIYQHSIALCARRQVRRWKDKALQARENNIRLEMIALRHDRKALLHSALDAWLLCFLQKRQVIETRRFFEHLERRATKARDLYLLHIAFTHWSTYTNEQVQRTALARRHIVRTRIFNAWRDITAVNELKVRRQVLKKFFGVWKRQHSSTSQADTAAVQVYEANIVEKIYKRWVRKLLDLKATRWWAEGSKRRTLFRWIIVSHNKWENDRAARETRRLELSSNAWRIWRAKTETQVRLSQEATAYYEDNLCRGLVRSWRQETQVIPARRTLQTDVSVRLLRDAITTWLTRTRQERQAATVDCTRILREALTHWRHKARRWELITQIDRRVLLQCIYRWLLAARDKHAQKLLCERRLRGSLHIWIYKRRISTEQRWEQKDMAQSFAARRTKNLVLRQWYSRMETLQRNEIAAVDFYAPRLARGILRLWSEQLKHVGQLQQWSRDAEFYFLTSKSLKLWRTRIESVKREKRKAAYCQVRRYIKMNMVKGVLRKWQSKVQRVADLQAQAFDMSHNKTVILAMDIFDRWRGRAEELLELEPLARENALKKHFTVWKDRWKAAQALSTEATITHQELRQSRALKKWNLLALQLRAQINYAAGIREKNAKRNFRKIFLYWRQKAIQRRPLKRTGMSKSVQFKATSRCEAWSEIGEGLEIEEWAKGLDEPTVSTPLPGYLSTPSKRSERVMAAAARFSTTPKAPLSTPFERQLRAQWSGGLLPSLRKGPGRSTLGMGGGFADIPESSTNNDQESRGA